MSVYEAAEVLGASPQSVMNWIANGYPIRRRQGDDPGEYLPLRVVMTGKQGRNTGTRLSAEDVEAIRRARVKKLRAKIRGKK